MIAAHAPRARDKTQKTGARGTRREHETRELEYSYDKYLWRRPPLSTQ